MARLKINRIAIAVLAVCCCTSAIAVPAAIFVAMGATATTAAVLSVVSTVAFALIGSNMASNAAKRQQSAAAAAQRDAAAAQRSGYNAGLQDRNVTGLSAEAPWQVVYGNPAPVGGSLVSILSSGAKEEFKHLVVIFAAHECQAIDEIYLDGEAVGALDGAGNCTTGAFFESRADETITEVLTFNTSGLGTASRSAVNGLSALSYDNEINYPITVSGTTITLGTTFAVPTAVTVTYTYAVGTSRVNIQKHLSPAGVDTVDAYLSARVGSAWGAADKLSGYTYVVISLDQNLARFQGGPPNVTAKLRGKKVYDFRTATTVYSANPALCLADFIRSEAGYDATIAQFDGPSAIAAANAADVQGFTCDGAFKTEQDRETTKQQLEDCFGATCHQSGGVWRIGAGAWTTPVMSLTNADMAGPIQITQASYTSKERFNTVRGKYINGTGLGVATDFSPWQNAAYVVTDGLVKVKDITLPFTKDHQRAQDLARMIVERSRGGLAIAYPAHMRAWPLQPGDRVSVTNAEFGWAAKTFRMTDWGFSPTSPVGLTLVEDVAAFYDAAIVITADAAPNTNLPDPYVVPGLMALNAVSGTAQLLRQTDGSITTRVLLTWVAATNNYVSTGGKVQRQWRLATALDNVWTTENELSGDASSAYQSGLVDGVTVLLRARFVSQLGIPGAWTTIAHTVVGKTEPPSQPASVGLTQSLVFFAKVTDDDLAGYIIRSQPGMTGVFSRATPMHDGIVTASPFTITTRLYGQQTIMVAAVDTTGNIGTPAVSTLDFGSPDSSAFVQSTDYRVLGFPTTRTACTVSGGDLVADALATSNVYALADLYGELDLYATNYADMQWITSAFVPAYGGCTLSLAYTAVGSVVTVGYRIDGDNIVDLYASTDLYASANLYGAAAAFQPWPGAINIGRMTGVEWRVSIDSSTQQGKVTAFMPSLAAPEIAQTFANQTIASTGTRLNPASGTPPCKWITLRSVQVTPFVDGSGAIAGRLLDFSHALGPLAQLVNNLGAAVSGTATVELRGLVDV